MGIQVMLMQGVLVSRKQLAKAFTDLAAATERLGRASTELQQSNVTSKRCWTVRLPTSMASRPRLPPTVMS